MSRARLMQTFARWHIWLGWLVGVPLLMWTISGLIMVIRPIDEVRGEHLRQEITERALPSDTNIAIMLPQDSTRPVKSVTTAMADGRPVTTITHMDGSIARFGPDGAQLPQVGEIAARLVVAERIEGGDRVASATLYEKDEVPFDFRRPMAVWQVALEDGTHVYVSRDTGEIAAVRTRWWRLFDLMWGLHIMDLDEREDTSHPILILFAALSLIGVILGSVLMFRRRKAKKRPKPA